MLFVLILSSCGVKKEQQRSVKLGELSTVLKIPVQKNDPDLALYTEVANWMGIPYCYGGNSRRCTDCSGFVGKVYQSVYGKKLGRSAQAIADNNVKNISKGKLKTGDLVFFNTLKKKNSIDHVGIYLKDGYFIHASTRKGVMVNRLDEDYYRKNWRKGGRVK